MWTLGPRWTFVKTTIRRSVDDVGVDGVYGTVVDMTDLKMRVIGELELIDLNYCAKYKIQSTSRNLEKSSGTALRLLPPPL